MHWEFVFLDFIATHLRTDALTVVMRFVSALGNMGSVWILISVLLLCNKKYRYAGLASLLALLLSHLIGNVLLKPLFCRPRPFQLRPDIIPLSFAGGYSFPSGHTITAFAAASAMLPELKKRSIPAMVLAVLIGFSRLYLYVHFPTDVLTGMLLGILIGLLCGSYCTKNPVNNCLRDS